MKMSYQANIKKSFKILRKQMKEDKYYWIGDVVVPMGVLLILGMGATHWEDMWKWRSAPAACHLGWVGTPDSPVLPTVPLSTCLESPPFAGISWDCSRRTRSALRLFAGSSYSRSNSSGSRKSIKGSCWLRGRNGSSSRKSRGGGWKR